MRVKFVTWLHLAEKVKMTARNLYRLSVSRKLVGFLKVCVLTRIVTRDARYGSRVCHVDRSLAGLDAHQGK